MFSLRPDEFIVGLGSNASDAQGGALAQLRRAKHLLQGRFALRRCSSLYVSDALLPEGAPPEWDRPYLNAALRLASATPLQGPEAAQALLRTLKEMEVALGRAPAPRWAPRLIDLDLLAWGGPPVASESLQVPHVALRERAFALLPLEDCLCLPAPPALNPAWRFGSPEQVPFRTQRAAAAWPATVGIVNATPDSFSADGLAGTPPAEVESKVREHIRHGATVIDLGAESTRPGAPSVTDDEETRRLEPILPLVARLKRELGFTLSLDCRHPATVARALELCPDLDWINDVTGLTDPRMLEIAARTTCDVVVMHSLSVPPRPGVALPAHESPVDAIARWAQSRIEACDKAGIPRGRIILDPGLGFGKTLAQNHELLARAGELTSLGCRVLIGHSRKRFLDPQQEHPAHDRDIETAILTATLACSGVDYVRVHDSAAANRALTLGNRHGRSAPTSPFERQAP